MTGRGGAREVVGQEPARTHAAAVVRLTQLLSLELIIGNPHAFSVITTTNQMVILYIRNRGRVVRNRVSSSEDIFYRVVLPSCAVCFSVRTDGAPNL